MQGNFDFDYSAYPVGFLRDSRFTNARYYVAYMPNMSRIHPAAFTLDDAVAVAAHLNKEIRDGAPQTEEALIHRCREITGGDFDPIG